MSALTDTGCKPQAHGQSEPGGGACPRCDRPRCCATAKSRDGERCRKNPHPGATICTNHGLTVAGRAKAERVRQEQAAAAVLARVWDPEAVPVRDAVGAMQQLAGRLTNAADVLGAQLDIGDICEECGRGDKPLDPVNTAAWLRTVRESRQLLADMERLGIAEQMIQVEAAKVRLMSVAFGRVLDELGVDDEVRRERLGRLLVTEMRALATEPDVVAGEAS